MMSMVSDPINVLVCLLGICLWPGMTLAIILVLLDHWFLGLLAGVLALVRVGGTETQREKVVEKIKVVEKVVFRGGRMTKEDAYSALGLTPPVTRDAVLIAYRSMIAKVHPDRGGSNYLAAKVNEARQLLLG